jgi:long-subunit fatty acid transport protein
MNDPMPDGESGPQERIGVEVRSGIGRTGRGGALALLAGCLLLPSLVQAGGFHVSVIGGRRNGMLANLASPADATAVFHNPAGLPDLEGSHLELFCSAAFLSNEFRMMALDPGRFPEINPPGCGSGDNPPCPWPIGDDGYYEQALRPESTFAVLPFLGFTTDLSALSRNLRGLAAGVAVYAPDVYGGNLGDNRPTSYFMTEGYFLVLATTLGIGWRLSDHVSLGFNLSYNYVRMSFAQRMSFANALTPPGQRPDALASAVQKTFGDALLEYTGEDHGAGWTASALVRPTKWLSLAVVFGASSPARLSGPLSLRPTRPGVDSFEDLEALNVVLPTGLEVDMPIPPYLGFGLNAAPLRWLSIGLDCRFWFYQVYDVQRIRPVYPRDAAGIQPITEASLSRRKNNNLTYEIALGFLFRPLADADRLELMVGIGYDQSPAPDEYFSLDNPSLSTILLSTGLRWRASEHLRIALAYIGMIYVERDVRTSRTDPPTNVRGGGSNHMPSLEVEVLF